MNARWRKWLNICWRTQSTKNAALGSVTASVGGWMVSRVGSAMCESCSNSERVMYPWSSIFLSTKFRRCVAAWGWAIGS